MCARKLKSPCRTAGHAARKGGIRAVQFSRTLRAARDFPRRKCQNLSATTRIGGCPAPASLLEILRSIPDHRRNEGKRFDLSTVLLYAILSMVAGANSYRQVHEFIVS